MTDIHWTEADDLCLCKDKKLQTKYKTITEDSVMPVLLTEMLTNLINANNEVYNSFSKVFDLATAAKEQGLANFAADRMDTHRKHGWMLKASLKKIG